jgi:hypothetical protein
MDRVVSRAESSGVRSGVRTLVLNLPSLQSKTDRGKIKNILL